MHVYELQGLMAIRKLKQRLTGDIFPWLSDDNLLSMTGVFKVHNLYTFIHILLSNLISQIFSSI